nr:EOG090X0F1W [Cyclestheria hislopi]
MGSNNDVGISDRVLVTGFGPFGTHEINASWEAVKLLPNTGIEKELNISLIVHEIPVEYDYVKRNIPILWQVYKPKLTIHVGVSGSAHEVNLERQAFNSGYKSRDNCDCVPVDNQCIPGAPDCVQTGLNMGLVCQQMIDSSCEVTACVSDDPGRFLCDYIYYSSLNIDASRAAFIHVPVLGKPYTALQLAQALKIAIKSMLEQVRANDAKHS